MLPSLYERVTFSPVSVTPSDTVDLPGGPATSGLFLLTTGNIVFVSNGVTVTLTAVPALTRLPFVASRVRATGTTATVLALY